MIFQKYRIFSFSDDVILFFFLARLNLHFCMADLIIVSLLWPYIERNSDAATVIVFPSRAESVKFVLKSKKKKHVLKHRVNAHSKRVFKVRILFRSAAADPADIIIRMLGV